MKKIDPPDRKTLSTEQQNSNSHQIDKLSISEILQVINDEDQTISQKIKKVIPQIEKVVNFAEEIIRTGGKIFYIGAGTSGRLGVLLPKCHPHFLFHGNCFRESLQVEKKL